MPPSACVSWSRKWEIPPVGYITISLGVGPLARQRSRYQRPSSSRPMPCSMPPSEVDAIVSWSVRPASLPASSEPGGACSSAPHSKAYPLSQPIRFLQLIVWTPLHQFDH